MKHNTNTCTAEHSTLNTIVQLNINCAAQHLIVQLNTQDSTQVCSSTLDTIVKHNTNTCAAEHSTLNTIVQLNTQHNCAAQHSTLNTIVQLNT